MPEIKYRFKNTGVPLMSFLTYGIAGILIE